jgi:hypothetical protein
MESKNNSSAKNDSILTTPGLEKNVTKNPATIFESKK